MTAGWSIRRSGTGAVRRRRASLDFPNAHAQLTAGLPNANLHDADLLVNWIHSVKSDVRKASRLAEAAVTAAYKVNGPGVCECEAIAKIQAAQIAGSPEFRR